MPEITRPGEKTRQSIAPSTSAPSAPTMDAPGARTMTDPTTPTSRRREAATREKFRDIERDYGRSKYLHHRRDEMQMHEGPETPVSDAYVITMRRQGAAPGLVSLDDLVVQGEQREREEWLREEEYRATVLPGQLQRERQYLAQMEYINKLYAEQGKRIQEQRARDTEAQKYGYETDAELQAAIREEKAIKRANELGLALTEAQLIAQTVAREGYTGATAYYGRDPGEMIEEQRNIGAAAQASLEQNFEIAADPRHQEYFKEVSDFTALHREAAATAQPGSDPLVDSQLGLRIGKAGMSFKTSDYPAPPTDLKQGTVRLVKDADGSGWNVEPSTQSLPTDPKGGELSELERILKTPSFLLSPVGQFAQDVFKDQEAIAQAESDYEEAYRRYEERLTAAEGAGLIVGDEFLVSDQATQLQYDELKIAAEAVDSFGKEAEDLRKRELFGIPYRFGEMEKGLAGALNLPALSKEDARALTKAQELLWAAPRISPEVSEIKAGVLSGAYSGVRDRPLTGIASLGIGFVGGLAMKGAALLPKAGKGLSLSLKGIEAAWVGTVGARVGISGISGDPFAAGETFGGILTTEALPVAAGAGAVRYVPGMISARFPRGSGPGTPPGTPPARQMVFDLTGEIAPPRHVATTGRTRVFGTEADFPTIRDIARTGGVRVHGTEIDFPAIREVARVGGSKIHGTEADFPTIREIAEVGGVKVYGTEADFPVIRELGRDAAGVRVFDATGLAEPELVGVVDTAPSRGPGPRRGVEVLYTPEALGARQRTIMSQRKAARTITSRGSQQLIRPSTPQKAAITPTKIQRSDPGSMMGISLNAAAIAKTISQQTPKRDQDEIRVTIPDITDKVSDAEFFTPQIDVLPKVDQTLIEINPPTVKSTQTPDQDQPQVKIPAVAVDLALAQEQLTVQIPQIRSPDPIRRPHIRIEQPPPPPPPPGFVFPDGLNVDGFGDEFYVHYAERPNPLASLEEAYTNLPGPKIRPAKVITNLQRITIGTPPKIQPIRAPKTRTGKPLRRARQNVPWDVPSIGLDSLTTPPKIQPIRAKAVKVGPPVKRARQKVPWDVTTTPTRRARPTRRQAAPAVNLDFLGIGVAPAKRKRKSKKRR